jgi:hypothetical protein
VSDYQGATFVHDLNSPETPEQLKGQYQAVSMGGTAEHVFFVGNTLRCAAELLAIGGIVICSGPANNWLDHGFYQLCPTLKFDFFESNKFEFGMSIATLYRPGESLFRRVIPVYPGEVQALNFIPARISHTLQAKKVDSSTCHVVPLQTIYRVKHNGELIRWRFKPFAPYDYDGEQRRPAPLRSLPLQKARAKDGCWAFPFRQEGLLPSTPKRPFRSKALVYENGRLLDWIVSDASMVSERPGSFFHAGAFIYLSTPDGSDPNTNGRSYEVAFPQPFTGLEPYADDALYKRDIGPVQPVNFGL